jgi:ABC-type phosphate/phosphonate transport system substrate-binding protein
VKRQFPADYKKMIKSMKRGELDKVYDEIKAYLVAYKTAHLLVLDEDDDDKLASVLNGPLCGVPSNEKILH